MAAVKEIPMQKEASIASKDIAKKQKKTSKKTSKKIFASKFKNNFNKTKSYTNTGPKTSKIEEKNADVTAQTTSKKPICFNYEMPCKDCVMPVEFGKMESVCDMSDDILLNYYLIESFSPRTEDWVGLFRLCLESVSCFEFVAFQWAQKKASFKHLPHNRSVVFYPTQLEVSTNEKDKYVFLYLSTNERILGQSSIFTFKSFTHKKMNVDRLTTKIVSHAFSSAINNVKTSPSNLAHELETENDENWCVSKDEKIKLKKKERIQKKQLQKELETVVNTANSLKTASNTLHTAINLIKEKQSSVAPTSTINGRISAEAIENNHVAKMIGMFEHLIRRDGELNERIEKMEKTNLALILSQQLVQQDDVLKQQQDKHQSTDCLREAIDLLKLKISQSSSHKPSTSAINTTSQNASYGGKNFSFYHPSDDMDVCDVTSANQLQDRKKLLSKMKERFQNDEAVVKVRKAVTDIADLLKEIGRKEEEEVMRTRSAQNHTDVYKHLFDLNLEEAKRNIKADKSMIRDMKKKKDLSAVYSGSAVGLRRLFEENDVDYKGKWSKKSKAKNSIPKYSAKEISQGNDLQLTRLKPHIPKANYSIRLMYGNKHDISASVPDMTLKKLFEDICTNDALIVDVAKDRSILIQPFNNYDNSTSPFSLSSLKDNKNMKTLKLKAINKATSACSKDFVKSGGKGGPNLFTTTSNVLEELKEISRQEKILTSCSYPSRRTNSTKTRLENIQTLLNSCFSNDASDMTPLDSSPSNYSGKLSDISMKVNRGSFEGTNSPLVQSPAVTKLTLFDSFDILSPAYKETIFKNSRLKKDHSAKLMLITNILESNMTDENKILTLKQIMEACPILSQLEKNSRKQFSPLSQKTRTRFSDIIHTEHETSDSQCDVKKADDISEKEAFFYSRVKKAPLKKPSFKIGCPLRRRRRWSRKNYKKTASPRCIKTEYLVKKIVEKISEEKQISTYPRLIRKDLPSNFIMRMESRSSVEDESRMKPILKHSSPHSIRPCQLSHRYSSDFLNDLQNDMDYHQYPERQAGSSRQADIDENTGNFKRERKVSFNTIILTSLFDDEDADNVVAIKKDERMFAAPNEKKSSSKDEKPKASALQKFLDLLEREITMVTKNAFEIQNAISKAVFIFKGEAINLKNKYAKTLKAALRPLSPKKYRTGSPPPTLIEMKTINGALTDNKIEKINSGGNKKVTASFSIDHFTLSKALTNHPNTSPNLTNVEIKKANEIKNNIEYPFLPVSRKSQLKTPFFTDDVKSNKDKEEEIQKVIDSVFREVMIGKSPNQKTFPDWLSMDSLHVNNTSAYKEEAKIKKKKQKKEMKKIPVNRKKIMEDSSTNSIRLSDYCDEEGLLTQISATSLSDEVEMRTQTPVVSLYSEKSNNSLMSNTRTQKFYNNSTPYPRYPEFDSQSNPPFHPSYPSLNIIQSIDSTISSIVQLYSNITGYVHNQPPIRPAHSNYPEYKRTNDAFLNKKEAMYDHKSNHKENKRSSKAALFSELPSCVSRDYNDLVLNLKKKLSEKSSSDDQRDDSYEEMFNMSKFNETSLPFSENAATYASKASKNVEKKDMVVNEVINDDINKDDENEICLTCSNEFPSLKATVENVINKMEKNKKD